MYFKENPILLLIDIGGTLLYRQKGNKIGGKIKLPDFKIKIHCHYYRPYYAEFLKSLVSHPRTKFALYSSIRLDWFLKVKVVA